MSLTNSDRWMILALAVVSGWLIYLLAPILTPFATAALLAYLGDPVTDRLEKWGLSRALAVSLVFLCMTLLLVVVLLIVIPLLEHQIESLIATLPAFLNWLRTTVEPFLQERLGLSAEQFELAQLAELISGHWREAGGVVATVMGSLSRSGAAVLGWLINLLLIPVVGWYLLRDWDVLIERIRELLPRPLEPTISQLARESDDVLGAFLRGQVTVMFALGLIYSVGLWFVGIDLAILIGMGAGLVSFVPYLGSIVGVAAGLIAAFYQFGDVFHIVMVLIVFGVGQLLEGMVLTPLLVGDKIGLHPVAVMFAVLAGGQLFGFLGVLLALPAAAVVNVLLRHANQTYRGSRWYGPDELPSGESAPASGAKSE